MELVLDGCRVRSWRAADADALVRYADNRKIWLNLRDRFPHPYTKADAVAFLHSVRRMPRETYFAIDLDGEAIGAVGFSVMADVERVSAEIGYWIGESFWGRGIATSAIRAVTQYAIERHALTRVFALPFAHNTASCRALEKAGFVLEGRLRHSAVKDGVIQDQLLFASYAIDRE